MKHVSPSVKESAFNCLHCRVLARQFWYLAFVGAMNKDPLPFVIDAKKMDELNLDHIEDAEERDRYMQWTERTAMGRPFFDESQDFTSTIVNNVWVSRC